MRNEEPQSVDVATRPTGSNTIRLQDILAESRWTHCEDPFPHILVKQVFIRSVYEQLSAAFQEIFPEDSKESLDRPHVVSRTSTFDTYLVPFRPSLSGPLSLFLSKPWVDLLAKVTQVNATRDVNGAFHYHAPGSENGFVHKDFSSCWFVNNPRSDGINVADNELCDYRTGETIVDGVVATERVRAVAMLFYLNNSLWFPGDGGETGLYRTAHDRVDRPAKAIPPINNSMLIFECSPHSYHSFIKNRWNVRSSVIMWLHRTKEDTVKRWGENSIVYVKA
jgi:hypothetical protein